MLSRDRQNSRDTEGTDDDVISVDTSASDGRAFNNGRVEAWWSYGSRAGPPSALVPTHPNTRYSLTGPGMFGGGGSVGRRSASGGDDQVVWDLSESLAELYERDQRRTAMTTTRSSSDADEGTAPKVDVASWLVADPGNGFVRVFAPDGVGVRTSRLVPCTTTTTAHKICLQLGIPGTSLHLQLAGDVLRRLEPHDRPLAIQNDYLTTLGYTNVAAMQAEGINEELVYLVKFYYGKPACHSTFTRKQLKSWINTKRGGLLQQWVYRNCVISGTRLLLYKDHYQKEDPTVFQLVKGSVEEVKLKGHELCLKLTSTQNGEKVIFLSFTNAKDYEHWLHRCKRATDKLPTVADLSSCHLEYLPENLFVNDQLSVLNLQHNTLREKPVDDDDIYVIGWLDDLARFRQLRVLNLADNDLRTFPLSICNIATLVQLNLANNKLTAIPPSISKLKHLQELHLHNNHLSSLPDDLTLLRRLFVLVLAFNRFDKMPSVLTGMTEDNTSEIKNIILAGNQIEQLDCDTMSEMRHVKKLDLRMNRLVFSADETVNFSVFDRLTHVDVRDNRVSELDMSVVRTLEYLNCERNAMASLHINGTALKNLFVACNCLETLVINPKPEWLLQMDVSDNCLESLPDWIGDCFFLQKLNANHNFLTTLPPTLFSNAKKLKSLHLNRNFLTCLPDDVDCLLLEELYLQFNNLTELPQTLLSKANKLRTLNLTKNHLTCLPPLNTNLDLNKVQELYLSGNAFTNTVMKVVSGYSRLKVLHLAQNELTEIFDDELRKLEMLYELNVSTNQLSCLPAAVNQLPKLVVLRAHSNHLRSLPDFSEAKSLRVLDVGHNQLMNVSVTNLMASQISLLDMSLNTQLKVDPREYKAVKSKKHVCLVDLTGQDRELPGLNRQKQKQLPVIAENIELDEILPWKVGFSETSGIRNKLCVSILKQLRFNADESLFGMFDGGHNSSVPHVIVNKMPDVLRDAMMHHEAPSDYMKYAMLAMHRRLKSTGQRLGAAGTLIHLQRHLSDGKMNQFTMNVANVGDVDALVCRHGEPLLLTKKFVTTADRDECRRVCAVDGIITEDGKVDGTTICTRLLGAAYLYPHVVPDPFCLSVALRADDEFIVVANSALWDVITPEDAVEEIYEIGNPVVAAKHLQDLAQAAGAKENVSVLVIRLNTDRGPSLARLRPTRQEMSIDDVEAAMAHDAALKALRAARAEREAAVAALTSDVAVAQSVANNRPSRPCPSSQPSVAGGTAAVGGSGTGSSLSGFTARMSFASSGVDDDVTPRNSSEALSVNSSALWPSLTSTTVTAASSPSPTSSSTSSGQTLRLNFSATDDDDDELMKQLIHRASQLSSESNDDEDVDVDDRFVRDIIRAELPPPPSWLFAGDAAASSVQRQPRRRQRPTSDDRDQPPSAVDPRATPQKPHFIKKSSSGVSAERRGLTSLPRNSTSPIEYSGTAAERRHFASSRPRSPVNRNSDVNDVVLQFHAAEVLSSANESPVTFGRPSLPSASRQSPAWSSTSTSPSADMRFGDAQLNDHGDTQLFVEVARF